MAKPDEQSPSGAEVTETEALGPPRRPPASAPSAPRASAPSAPRQEPGPAAPGRIGRFLPLKVLGQGGMGVVYAAYDPDLDRKVALKLLLVKGAGTDLEKGRLRLLREAQAMARVSHPHVIPVYEVGTWDKQVFVAMEFIDGGTLREWLEQPRGWREVLEKYLDAGRGLEAAHQAGLVHRDFKPANVMVSRTGRVYVTDFGLARQLKASEPASEPVSEPDGPDAPRALPPSTSALAEPLTAQGMVMGTPNYMSPEQFRGDAVDERSDQFSFCAALYKALYRVRPFDPDRMSEAAARRSPSRPRTGSSDPRAALEAPGVDARPVIAEPPRDVKVPAWVRDAILRGLSLEPAERFPSMRALLEALSQERRRVRRRQWAGAALLTGLVATSAAGAMYWRSQLCAGVERPMRELWGSAARQKLESAFRASGSPVAEEMLRRAVQGIDQYADTWTQQSLASCEATRVRQVQTEALFSQQLVCLERRRKEVDALVQVLSEADRAVVEKSQDAVRTLPSARDCADLEGLSEQQGRPSDPERRAELEQLEAGLARVRALLSTARVQPALEQAQQLEPRVLATHYLPLVAEWRLQEGSLQSILGKKDEGAAQLEQALYDAETARVDRLKLSALSRLLFVDGERRHFEEAARWARLGEAVSGRLGREPVLQSDLLVNRANVQLMQDKPKEALPLLEQARALVEPVLEPGNPRRIRVAFTLATTLEQVDQLDRAVVMLEDSLKQVEAAQGPVHMETAHHHMELALALRLQGQYARALEHAQQGLAIEKTLLGPGHLKIAQGLEELGMSQLGLKRPGDALRSNEQALSIKRQLLPSDDDGFFYCYDGVARALLELGRTAEGIQTMRQALAYTTVPEDLLGDSDFVLAQALWRDGQHQAALAEAALAHQRLSRAGATRQDHEVLSWGAEHAL